MKKIIILSGGLDSTVLTYAMVKEFGRDNVVALTFQYGQRHNVEVLNAQRTCQKLGIEQRIVDISFLGTIVENVSALSRNTTVDLPTITDVLGDPQPVTYVPYRNMIMTSIALSLAESVGANAVYTGLQVHDEYGYWDATYAFVDAINCVTNLNRKHNITVQAPYAELSKADEIAIGVSIGVDFADTWTCYRGEEGNGACGVCPSCSERIANFIKAGVKDPIPYEIDIDWGGLCVVSQSAQTETDSSTS